ncbi:hypothetical protein E2C01_088746 [Portunus trituberculatus]|uniref:Uncharacterized protein n=1 Tax=Portunus trituberculatus TaxID=210409 RepID=A0A5B7JBK8_PORTR|nr:hypothetical protein [Portunus trituberculatus]
MRSGQAALHCMLPSILSLSYLIPLLTSIPILVRY